MVVSPQISKVGKCFGLVKLFWLRVDLDTFRCVLLFFLGVLDYFFAWFVVLL